VVLLSLQRALLLAEFIISDISDLLSPNNETLVVIVEFESPSYVKILLINKYLRNDLSGKMIME